VSARRDAALSSEDGLSIGSVSTVVLVWAESPGTDKGISIDAFTRMQTVTGASEVTLRCPA